jgi:4-hydroxybenzoate polyprenyltransferase
MAMDGPGDHQHRVISESAQPTKAARRLTTVAIGSVKSLRLHQWSKNILVFVPLLLSEKFHDAGAWRMAVIGFLAFGLFASANYILNDLFDLKSDRMHWSKRHRPLASGAVPLQLAVLLAMAGAVASFALLHPAEPKAILVLAGYGLLALFYSLKLKRLPLVDILALSVLLTTRMFFGAVIADVEISDLLLVFGMFVFTSLSLAKRYTEVEHVVRIGGAELPGRGYVPRDLPLLLAMGVAMAGGAILILVFYVINDAYRATYYVAPRWLWLEPVLLFMLLGRVWLITCRGQMHDDPVVFVTRDAACIAIGGGMGLALVIAWSL